MIICRIRIYISYSIMLCKVTIEEFMNTWLYQINYPIVDVVLKQNQNDSTISFIQNRFTLSILDEEELFEIIESPYE